MDRRLESLSSGLFFDIAARDLVMASGAYALARLSEAHAHLPARRERVRVEQRPAHVTG